MILLQSVGWCRRCMFLFKQKTAYEWRISDWSSDVCSSDLAVAYVTGTQYSRPVTKLDAGGIQIQGDLFHLWAGPVTVATGVEARRESQSTSRGAQTVAGAFAIPLFSRDLRSDERRVREECVSTCRSRWSMSP